ncbi:hypothetical protein BDW59DRAFT_136919 [Aspergillus cavernicola]|uniref:Uncharacterized protein n=1 Tax=Aspergillus cavernicola TaxID=176166 RepID=A0ABR4J4L9_9EURO
MIPPFHFAYHWKLCYQFVFLYCWFYIITGIGYLDDIVLYQIACATGIIWIARYRARGCSSNWLNGLTILPD